MKRLITIIIFLLAQTIQAQFSVSAYGHYILRDGKDIFWLGYTGWELFHRLDRKEADLYLETRKRQGFIVIQARRSGYGQDWILVMEDEDKYNSQQVK